MWRHMTTENNAKNNKNARFKSVNLFTKYYKQKIIILVGPLLVGPRGHGPLDPLNPAMPVSVFYCPAITAAVKTAQFTVWDSVTGKYHCYKGILNLVRHTVL